MSRFDEDPCETVVMSGADLARLVAQRDAAVKDVERLREAFNVALVDMARLRDALDGAYSMAIGHACTYKYQHQLEDLHPTHDEALKKAYAALKGQP